ncbi:MAG: ATP synthase F1 subunit delta [Patescibacteria group bacterium]
MKYTSKHYATTLFRIIDGKKAADVDAVLKSFVETLAENSQIGKAKGIIDEFARIWNREKGMVEAEVISANVLDEETAEELKKYIADASGKKKVEINNKIDKKILGGAVIKYEDKIIDGSLKTRISELRERLIK